MIHLHLSIRIFHTGGPEVCSQFSFSLLGTPVSQRAQICQQQGIKASGWNGRYSGENYLHPFFFLSIWEQPHPHSLSLFPVTQVQISQFHKESIIWKYWECCWVGEHTRLQQVSFCYQRRKTQSICKIQLIHLQPEQETMSLCLFISET